jgi:hypothetical protein
MVFSNTMLIPLVEGRFLVLRFCSYCGYGWGVRRQWAQSNNIRRLSARIEVSGVRLLMLMQNCCGSVFSDHNCSSGDDGMVSRCGCVTHSHCMCLYQSILVHSSIVKSVPYVSLCRRRLVKHSHAWYHPLFPPEAPAKTNHLIYYTMRADACLAAVPNPA